MPHLEPDVAPPSDASSPRSPLDAAAGDVFGVDTPASGPGTLPGVRGPALLVVGSLTLDLMDRQLLERLIALGFTVDVQLDADVVAADTTGMAVVILSGSTFSNPTGAV